jgi:hypothetical protein
MALFSKPKLPSDKPKWMREQELEEQRRIQAALTGLRQSMASKTPTNLMLQSNRYLQASPYNTRFATSLLSSRPTLPGVSMDTGTYRTQ